MILLGILGTGVILVVFCWFDRLLSKERSEFGS